METSTTDHDNNMSLRVASFSCYLDTAKESLVHRLNSPHQDHTKINPSSPIKPPISIKFSNKNTQEGGAGLTNLRVDSFNSYLNSTTTAGGGGGGGGDHSSNFVFEVPGPIQDPTSAFTFSHQIPKDGGEIGVFGADKYFNMKMEYQTRANNTSIKNQTPANSTLDRVPTRRAPSLSSEASSWNSQTALLQRNESQMKQKKAMARRLFMGFGCRGPCFDKKSVHIDKVVVNVAQEPYYNNNKPTRTPSQRIDHHLSIALPLQPPPPTPPPPQPIMIKIDDLDQSRHSIEVFGSHNKSSKGDIHDAVATNMERKLSMLTWDAIPKGRSSNNLIPTSTVGSSTTNIGDDMASEASSDLFEIENISGSIYPLLTSELGAAADDICCMSPTSLYAPSEASIQWSVVTASAADYSALSEFNDESVSVAGGAVSKRVVAKRGGGKDHHHQVQQNSKTRPAGIFLGCKTHKAVDIAENVCVKTKINQ